MRSIRVLMCAIAISAMSFGVMAHAGVPILINHQGRLLDAADHPVSGSHTLTFQIFDNPASMTPLWTEVHSGVTIAEGLFTVTLGSITALGSDVLAPAGSGGVTLERYLEVKVDADAPLTPRTRLIAAPYAVASSRIAGDVETQPGEITVSNASGSRVDHTKASDDEAGHGNKIDGIEVISQQANADSSFFNFSSQRLGRPAINTARGVSGGFGSVVSVTGDDDGDGTAERGVASTNGAYVRARRANVHGWDSEPGLGSEFDLGADSVSSSLNLDLDSDGDGLADNTSTQTVRTSGVSLAIKTKGTGAQRFALNLGAGTDSSMIESTFDENGDGHAERQYNTLSNASKCRTVCAADLNSDGIPEYSATQTADAAGARLAIKTKGTGAHRLSVTAGASPDSSGIESAFDENGDGIAENDVAQSSDATGSRLAIKTKGTSAHRMSLVAGNANDSSVVNISSDEDGNGVAEHRMLAAIATKSASNRLSSDPNGDGVLESSVDQLSDDSSGSVTVVSQFAAGPRQTTSMDGTFSHSSHRTATDVDGDGTPESSTESYSDATTARIRAVLDNINVGARAQLQADDSGPSLTLDENAITRVLVSPDSGIQQYDAGGTKTVDFDANGDGYVAGNMKFGLISGAHRIDVVGGAYCDGTNWVNASDANSKENFAPVDGRKILEKLNHLDITRWNYKGQAEADHIGPTAQDFRQVFGVGSDGKSISTIDPSGIALAAIKELNKQNQQLRDQNQDLQNELMNLKKAVEKLQSQK